MIPIHKSKILIAFLFLCFYCTNTIPAQNAIADSLRQEISKATEDTSRFRLTNELILAINREDPDRAYQVLKAIMPEAEKEGHLPSLLDLYYTKGVIYAKRAQFDSTLLTMEKAKNIAIEIGDQANLAHILDQIGHAHFYKNQTGLGIHYLKEALALGEEIDNKKIIFKESANLGRLYTLSEKFDSAEILINHSLEIQEQLGDKRLQAEILVNLGLTVSRSQQIEKGENYFKRAIDLMQEIKDDQGLSLAYANLGYCYYVFGDFPNALESFHQALAIVEGTEWHNEKLQYLEHLSEIYLAMEDYDNALLYSQRTMETWEEAYGNKENADHFYKQGRILLLKKEYDEALKSFRKTFDLKTVSGQFIPGDFYWNIGQCFEHLSQPDSARVNYQKGIATAQPGQNLLLESQCLNGLGRIYEQTGNFVQALQYYQQAYNKAVTGGYTANAQVTADGIYRIHKQQNNAVEALHFHEIARTLQDSLFNEKNTKEITRMQANFEFEKEKQQLAFEQEKENERQGSIRRFLGLALLVVSSFLIIGYVYFRAKQKANIKLSKLNQELTLQKAIVEKQKERLEALDEVKSRFFTNISHEFRTPLTIITGMTDQIISKPEIWLEKGSQMIKQNSLNLLNLINQILDLRKLESGKLEVDFVKGDVIPYLRYIFESFESLAYNKDIRVHLLIEAKELVMDHDKKKLLRIVSNLLSNAIKFTPEGGDIYFMVNTLGVLKTPRVLTIKVKDTGIGIPEKKRPHIFDRFYQVDGSSTRVGEGTGIGLALCKELVTLLGGEIIVDSEEGVGTTFTVSIPITQNANPVSENLPDQLLETQISQAGISQTTKPTPLEMVNSGSDLPVLLLIEDNSDVMQYLVTCLENQYRLITAQDGEEGIEKALESIPDGIISDIMMPKKDGYEVCQTLKTDERTSHIPIILLTAKADMESRISGLKRGADDYLTKPFNEQELLTRLENQMHIRQLLRMHFREAAPPPKGLEEEVKQENEFLQKLKSNLEDHLDDEDYGILQICRALGLSRTQLHRKVKALTGQSTSLYLRRIRLTKGKELLETTDLNISQVAYEVGFRHPSYFSRSFAEEFGVAPLDIRNK